MQSDVGLTYRLRASAAQPAAARCRMDIVIVIVCRTLLGERTYILSAFASALHDLRADLCIHCNLYNLRSIVPFTSIGRPPFHI